MKQYGYPFALSQVVGIRFSKTGGWRRMLRWTGPDHQIKSLITNLKGKAIDLDYLPGFGGAESSITATFGTADDMTPIDDQVESIWELEEGEAYSSVWEHPKVQAIFAGRTVDDMTDARAAIEQYVSRGKTTVDEPYRTMIDNLRAGSANFDAFIKCLARTNNQATYYVPMTFIRHTLTGPINWRYQFDWDSVASQLYTATLVNNEPTIPFTVPPGRYWLTRLPTLRQLTNGKLQVTREWQESAEQDEFLYDQIT